MTDTAEAQLKRVLSVLPHVADGEEHSADEILARAGVDWETLIQDLEQVTKRFAEPPGFVDGVQIIIGSESVEVVTTYFRRPMRITGAELCALELGLAVLAGERPPEEQPAIARARARLRDAIGKLGAEEVPGATDMHAGTDDGRHALSLSTIRSAMRDRRKLRLTYRRGGEDTTTERAVCPYSLVFATGMWYLVAHCEHSEGVRIFRLDRVESLEHTEASYRVSSSFSLDAVLRDDRLFHAESPGTMTVRYSPRIARWIAERNPGTYDSAGWFVVAHPLADVEWGVRHVLQYGSDAEVMEPGEVRVSVRTRLAALVARLSDPGPRAVNETPR